MSVPGVGSGPLPRLSVGISRRSKPSARLVTRFMDEARLKRFMDRTEALARVVELLRRAQEAEYEAELNEALRQADEILDRLAAEGPM